MAEVAASRASCDLHQKKALYLRHGCLEYVVLVVHEADVLLWFALEGGDYRPLAPDASGVVRSRVFPGLWLDAPALVAGDAARVLETLRKGLASPEHAAFAKALEAKKRGA